MHPKTRARRGAMTALVAVETRDAILNAALEQCELPTDALPFARELAGGVLRHRSLVDYTLEPLLKKPLTKLDAPVRAALRLATYERAFLGTMAAAVADEYAAATRAARLGSAVAFINAVARRLPSAPRALPTLAPPLFRLATLYSHPQWLVERWLARLGEAECEQLLIANNSRAALSLRVNTLRATRTEVHAALAQRDLAVSDSLLSPDGLLVEKAGSPLGWPQWAAGEIIAQDEAAQAVSIYAAPPAGGLVVDAAAAPGGKTTHLAQLMGDRGQVIALDSAPGRVKLVLDNARRLGLTIIEARAGDFRSEATHLAQRYGPADLVLLDAPCLGTGTLRRRPDAKWKKTAAALAELVTLQSALLDAAAPLLKVGGRLVYSTCSLEPEENDEAAHNFLQRHANYKALPAPQGPRPPLVGEDGRLRALPQCHGCDGAFAVALQRNS